MRGRVRVASIVALQAGLLALTVVALDKEGIGRITAIPTVVADALALYALLGAMGMLRVSSEHLFGAISLAFDAAAAALLVGSRLWRLEGMAMEAVGIGGPLCVAAGALALIAAEWRLRR